MLRKAKYTYTGELLFFALNIQRVQSFKNMASGRTLLEHEEKKKPVGFFPQLFENVVGKMGVEGMKEVKKEDKGVDACCCRCS